MAIDVSKWQRHSAIKLEKNPNSTGSSDFPFLLDENSFRDEILGTGGDSAQSDGGDLRFSTDPYGRYQIPCEIVTWTKDATPANQKAQIWVRIPRWKHDETDHIYVWWKTSTTDSQPPAWNAYGSEAVWPSWYKYVYHCDESSSSSSLLDSTVNGYDVAQYNTPSSTSGKIQNARKTDRVDSEYFQAASNIGITGSGLRQIEFWVYLHDTNRSGLVVWGSNVDRGRFGLSIRNNHWWFWGYGTGMDWDTGVTPPTGAWTHVVVQNTSADHIEIYINGSRIGTGQTLTNTLNTVDGPLEVGVEFDGATTSYINGYIDEIRIQSPTIFTSDRITASYNQQNNPENYGEQLWEEAVSFNELNTGGWNKQARLTIDEHSGSSDAVDIPYLLDADCFPEEMMDAGSDSALFGGGDVRFSLDRHGLYPLNADVRLFDTHATPSSRRIEVWVRIPQWRMDFKNEIWVWWKKTGATQPSRYSLSGSFGVYTDGYRSVLPMFDGANPIDGKCKYRNEGTGVGTSFPNGVAGKIDKAEDFNGTDNYITIPYNKNMLPGTGDFSISMWIKPDTVTGVQQLFSKKGSGGVALELEMNGNKLEIYTDSSQLVSTGTLSIGTWYKVKIERVGTTLSIYINGSFDSSTTNSQDFSSDGIIYIGADSGSSQFYDGLIDEFRWVVGSGFGAAYDKAEYENQNDPSNLLTIGPMQEVDLFWGFEFEHLMEVDKTYVDSDETGFPVCLTEDNLPSEVFTPGEYRVKDDGGDLVIGSVDGKTRYPVQIEHWDQPGQKAEVWVRVPSILAATNVQFKLYWHKPGHWQPPEDNWYGKWAVWDRFFEAVWHLNEATLNNVTFEDYFMEEEFVPYWTTPAGAGAMADDFISPDDGWIEGPGQGDDTKFFDPTYTGSWTVEVFGIRGAAQSHGVRMLGDGSTVIEAYADGTNLYAKCTGQTDHSQSDPFTAGKTWLKVVYDSSAQTLTFYYSTNSNNKPESDPDPWVQYKQYTSINLGSEKFAPELNNSDSGKWGYVKVTGSNGSPGTMKDSTRFGHHQNGKSNLPTQIDGLVWKAQDYNGSSDYGTVDEGISQLNGSDMTLETTSKRDALNSGMLMGQGNTGTTRDRLHYGYRDNDTFTLAFWADDLDSTTITDITNFIHWAGTYQLSDNAQKLFKNGVQDASRTAGGSLNGKGVFEMGRRTDIADYFDGKNDESRISTKVRSAGWLKATWNTMKNIALFCSESGSMVIRKNTGRVRFQGNKLVDLNKSNRVPFTTDVDLDEWLNKGTQLGKFVPFGTPVPWNQDQRGWLSVRFDADADLLKSNFSHPSSLLGNNSWAIEAWFYMAESSPNSQNALAQIGKRGTALQLGELNSGFHPQWGAASFFGPEMAFNPSDLLIRMRARAQNLVHLVLTYNGTEDKAWLFVNAVENNSVGAVLNLQDNGVGIMVGGAINSGGTAQEIDFKGDIFALRIYDDHMGIGDIINNYHLGLRFQSNIMKLIGSGGLQSGGLTKGALT